MYGEMERYGVDPGSLVHALQNHDEFTYELVHLAHLESLRSAGRRDIEVYEKSCAAVKAEMRREALHIGGDVAALTERIHTPFYNKESPNGLCTTIAGLMAAKLGCKTLEEASGRTDEIRRGHLLLAAFNALQPGAFALSGWDLVGALPVEEARIPPVLLNAGPSHKDASDQDFRWVNRGAYRLISDFGGNGSESDKRYGCLDLPEAQALYGPLDKQRSEPDSFFNQLKRILSVRAALDIPTGRFAGVLDSIGDGCSAF